jgi:predicted MPP superfamily phosphohydrolase
LINEHEIIRKGDDAIVMAGVTDISTRHMGGAHASDPGRAIAGAPADAPKILLAHQPASFDAAEKAGFDLQLSGHTHAGQYFPFSMLIGFFQRYVKGLNKHGAMWVYVNRGTGYWGPPLRTGVPPEITLITLRA